MAIQKFNASWVGVYRESGNRYHGSTSPIRTGAGNGYNSYLGFNSSAIRSAMETSKTTPKVWLNIYVTQAGTMDFGMHKETTNKAKGTMPYYAYTGRSFAPVTGWRRYDITSFTRSISGGGSTFLSALKGGFHGIVLYGGIGGAYAIATGATGGNRVYVEVEGQWNTPPSTTTFTSPGTGVIVDKNIEIKWKQATDAEQSASQLTYEINYWNGSKWSETFSRKGILLYTYPLHDKPETSSARFRIRVYDGQAYSGYKYSNYFTVNHNKAPTQPTLTGPIGGLTRDRTDSTTFSWKHNDDDAQSKYNFRYRLKGVSSWTTITNNTNRTTHTLAGNVLPFGEIEWQVQTYDQGNLISPWSITGLFLATEASDAPSITYPMHGASIDTSEFLLQWSSSEQAEYEVELRLGDNVVWSTSQVGTTKMASVAETLENATEYTASVRIKSNLGLWSSWASVSFHTSFTPPLVPEVTIRTDVEYAAIIVDVFNPESEGEEPLVIRNVIERRKYNGDWLRLADNVLNTSAYIDYTPASETVYEYRAIAIGINGTTTEGNPDIGSIEVEDVILSLVSNPTEYIKLVMNLGGKPVRSYSLDVENQERHFAGRARPVTEFGELTTRKIDTQYTVKKEDYINLLSLIEKRGTLLYRDSRGRKVFVVATGLTATDEILFHYSINIPLSEVDYIEGVRMID